MFMLSMLENLYTKKYLISINGSDYSVYLYSVQDYRKLTDARSGMAYLVLYKELQ